jgi:uncharacterized RDD family membrane protein YckC
MEKYHTAWRRVLASFIDAMVFIPLYIAEAFLADPESKIQNVTWVIILELLGFVYSIYFHSKYGQTIGKMLAGITVMDLNEEKIVSLKQAILRDSIWIGISLIAFIYLVGISLFNNGDAYEQYMLYDDLYGNLSIIWVLVELLSMLTNSKRRAVHDYIAGSVVIITDDYIGQHKAK